MLPGATAKLDYLLIATSQLKAVVCIIGFDKTQNRPKPCPYIFYPAYSWDVEHKHEDFKLVFFFCLPFFILLFIFRFRFVWSSSI